VNEPARDASTWIAEASHELRLPIANLKLLIETLLDGAVDDPQACKRMLSRANQEVERLERLVVDLLSIEQAADSRHELRCQWNVLEDRAAYAVDSLKALAGERRVSVHVEIEPGWLVFASPEQLDQVLLNLLENALKFTPEGGQVWIRSGQDPGSFAVEDTGIGLSASEIPKIFERFYRVDRASSRGSTGLGLSIVKHIVDLHGAKISVLSEERRGSTFVLQFPGPQRMGRPCAPF